MKKIISIIVLLALQSTSLGSNYFFENIPIQDAGRIKPMDTYAEKTLLSIYEKRALKEPTKKAVDWLIESIVNPQKSYSINVFKIKSREVADALDLEWRDPHYYSYSEISGGINRNIDYFLKLYIIKDDQKTVIEKQLSNLFSNIGSFKSITNSFSCLEKTIKVYHPEILKQLDLDSGAEISYLSYVYYKSTLDDMAENFSTSSKLYKKSLEDSLSLINNYFDELKTTKFMGDPFYKTYNLKIIPSTPVWISPWELLNGDIANITEDQKELLMIFESYIRDFKNIEAMESSSANYLKKISKMGDIDIQNIKRETAYNESDSFYYSLVMYILSFLLLGISWITNSNIIKYIGQSPIRSGLLTFGGEQINI